MKTAYTILSKALNLYHSQYFTENGVRKTFGSDKLTVSDFIANAAANAGWRAPDAVRAVRVASRFGDVFDPHTYPEAGLAVLKQAKRAAR